MSLWADLAANFQMLWSGRNLVMMCYSGNGIMMKSKEEQAHYPAGPGRDFMYNGKVEGIFTDEGGFDIESDIIPFLSA